MLRPESFGKSTLTSATRDKTLQINLPKPGAKHTRLESGSLVLHRRHFKVKRLYRFAPDVKVEPTVLRSRKDDHLHSADAFHPEKSTYGRFCPGCSGLRLHILAVDVIGVRSYTTSLAQKDSFAFVYRMLGVLLSLPTCMSCPR